MSEATKVGAKTIHGLLEWRPGSEPGFGPGHPLLLDMLIVDESSMINLHMAEVPFQRTRHRHLIVLVGDMPTSCRRWAPASRSPT